LLHVRQAAPGVPVPHWALLWSPTATQVIPLQQLVQPVQETVTPQLLTTVPQV
jgi:hypothetical protein